MEWTSSNIQVWFFPRDSIPAGVTATNPDPSTFGEPVANIAGSCDIDTHFWDHAMVFDTTFCGSWAGNVFQTDGCPMTSGQDAWPSCVTYVAENPTAFQNSYWAINSIKIYQAESGVSPSVAVTSSATPAASTASNSYTSVSVALGGSTSVYATSIVPSTTTSSSTTTSATTAASSTSAPPQTTTAAAASTSSHHWGPPSWTSRTWVA